MRVGFVGAGRMGAPMIARLVAAGHLVRALGRSDEKLSALVDLGATPVADIVDVASGAEVVVVCVFTDDQVREVCLDSAFLAALPDGATLVLHTTGSPNTAEAIAAHAPNVKVVDAPLSGGPHDIAAGAVTLFVGGSDDAVAGVAPVLAAYGNPVLRVGPLGSGQKVKLINNVAFAAQLGLIAEVVRFAGDLGVAESAMLAALGHGSGSSRALSFVASAGSIEGFIAGVGEFIGKDVAVARATADELGAGLGALDTVVTAAVRA